MEQQGVATSRRSPSGERGLKYEKEQQGVATSRRSPSGERGLKSVINEMTQQTNPVAPHPGSVD